MVEAGKVIINKEGDYSVAVPQEWQVNTNLAKPDLIMLLPPGRMPNQDSEYVADITISSIPNPLNLTITEFYDREAFDLPKISRTRTFFQLNGFEAARFKGVPGEVSSTIVVVNMGQQIIEIVDINEGHQTDGIFDDIVSSVIPL